MLRGRFEVTELVLEKPIFNLLKQADGSFNYSDIGSNKTPANNRREPQKKTDGAKSMDAPPPLALPNRVRVNEGQLNLITKGLIAGQISKASIFRSKSLAKRRRSPFASRSPIPA